MRAARVTASAEELLSLDGACWRSAREQVVALAPTPMAMVQELSPLMASSTDHGAVRSLRVRALHNGSHVALRLTWSTPDASIVRDLDQFADAVAVMFPMHPEAIAITMGGAGRPVNAWFWRAGDTTSDVVAEGFGTSRRRKPTLTGLEARSQHSGGEWHVVLVRPLVVEGDAARFEAGTRAGIGFAVWDGARAERAARKSATLVFDDLELDG